MTKASLADKKVQDLVDELCAIVRSRYPDAEFEVFEGDDPRGVYIHAYTEGDQVLEIIRLVSGRITEIIEEEEVIIAVIPLPKRKGAG